VETWEYPEKEEMFKYYPQYYHKTDKVRSSLLYSALLCSALLCLLRILGPSRSLHPPAGPS